MRAVRQLRPPSSDTSTRMILPRPDPARPEIILKPFCLQGACGGGEVMTDFASITKVNWRTARIDGPVFDKACVRFYYEFDWNGDELLLQSRAMDETGYVQPSKETLRQIRGVNSIYHNNGIQAGALKANGEVENVEVG